MKFLFPRLGDLAICLLITCYPAFHSARYFYKEAPSMGDRALVVAFSALFAYNTVWSWSRPLADLLVTWLNNRCAIIQGTFCEGPSNILGNIQATFREQT